MRDSLFRSVSVNSIAYAVTSVNTCRRSGWRRWDYPDVSATSGLAGQAYPVFYFYLLQYLRDVPQRQAGSRFMITSRKGKRPRRSKRRQVLPPIRWNSSDSTARPRRYHHCRLSPRATTEWKESSEERGIYLCVSRHGSAAAYRKGKGQLAGRR